MVRSGSTSTRPARSSGTPSERASGDAATPAAQITVRAGRRLPPRSTPSASMPVTRWSVITSTPSRSSRRWALADSFSG